MLLKISPKENMGREVTGLHHDLKQWTCMMLSEALNWSFLRNQTWILNKCQSNNASKTSSHLSSYVKRSAFINEDLFHTLSLYHITGELQDISQLRSHENSLQGIPEALNYKLIIDMEVYQDLYIRILIITYYGLSNKFKIIMIRQK